MNKKVLSSCLALTLLVTASAPVYNKLSLTNDTGYSLQQYEKQTEYETLRSESLELKKSGILIPKVAETAVKAENTLATTTVNSETVPAKKQTTTAPTKPSKTTTSKTTTSKASLSSRGTTSTTKSRTTTTKSATTAKTTSVKPTTTNTTSTETSSKAKAVINTAKNYMGVPYVWGGTTPSGFDCSGFTQYVLGRNGISVPRTSAEQYTAGISVSRSNLKVGDLVFFTTYKPGPSHLGFYLGDGNFIHASSSKGVTISSLDSSYYSSRYIGARRVIK